ncbi:MAG: di-heme oxidoredictase family protein [Bryobacteraceae bacterium]
MRARFLYLLVFTAVWVLHSQTSRYVQPGSPLPGITPREMELFRLGLEDFMEVETAEEGLGPAFNGTSCAVCHSVPAVGGISTMTEIRAGHRDENGHFTALNGGTLYQLFSTPGHRCQVQIPAEANVIARRMPIPVFGAGLVEAIPDQAIIALEDPDDRNGDGISGRAARIKDVATGEMRIGRFGWKAQQATLLAFAADAYRNEMGITNDLFPDELAAGIDPAQMKLCGAAVDVEDVRDRRTGLRGIDNFESFMKFLAPIERGPVTEAAMRGEVIFRSIGCASCHIPQLLTGHSLNPLFNNRPVNLFSDLLLHDVGTGDAIEQDDAAGEEIRTPALWGLRFRRPFLHDGSAATPEAAVRRHGNEAAVSARAFESLLDQERKELLAFLQSL